MNIQVYFQADWLIKDHADISMINKGYTKGYFLPVPVEFIYGLLYRFLYIWLTVVYVLFIFR